MTRMQGTLICIILLGLQGLSEVAAQTSDRVHRVDRLDRARERSVTRDRIIDRPAADRRVATRIIDEPESDARKDEIETATPDADTQVRPTIIQDERGDRVRRGEMLALNPSLQALDTLSRLGLRQANQRDLGNGDHLHIFRADRSDTLYEAIAQVRRLDPAGVYTTNHVFSPSQVGSDTTGAQPPTSPESADQDCDIGVIDGPIDTSLPLLTQPIVAMRAFDTAPQGSSAHGTAVAARLILAAKGFAPHTDLRICAANVFTTDLPGSVAADTLAAAIGWQQQQGAVIVNISLAGPDNEIVAYMVARYLRGNRLMVAAAGNGGQLSRNIYPAAYDGVIGVTAIDDNGQVYPLATRGRHVDLAAIGVDLDFSMMGIDQPLSGTSFAAPVITAWLATKGQSGADLGAILTDLGPSGHDDTYGAGALFEQADAQIQLVAVKP